MLPVQLALYSVFWSRTDRTGYVGLQPVQLPRVLHSEGPSFPVLRGEEI